MNYLSGLKTLLAIAIVTVALSSCSEDQTSLSINDIQGKATIIGSFVYNDGQTYSSSTTTPVSPDKPAMNVKMYVKIENSSLSPNNNAQGYTTFETSTDANGEYEIEIPAVENGVEVSIQAESFIGKKYSTTSGGTTGIGNSVLTKEGVYEAAPIQLSGVKPNDIIAAGKKSYNFTSFDHTVY
ncbi:hypothetical protein [uncultured Bacteroides sp.]|jgi:hypothetical protein|uniref:hypothetical protein n=1 Tax=uncultured Bacteroides sp. TaxID=162156 RepID=UPI00280A5B1F|nr:hypothetical protein [uncultured Bacteroides sp.]